MDKAKIIVVVTALALGLSLSAAAQQDATSASSSAHPSETPTRTAEITIRGCISGGKRYTFMQASTGEMFALAGKADRFASARGKLIEITANEFAPEAKSDQLPELRVNILRVIADKCPIQAHPEPRMPNPAATSPGPPPPASSPATRVPQVRVPEIRRRILPRNGELARQRARLRCCSRFVTSLKNNLPCCRCAATFQPLNGPARLGDGRARLFSLDGVPQRIPVANAACLS